MNDSLFSGLIAIVFVWFIVSLVSVGSGFFIQTNNNYYDFDEEQCVKANMSWVEDELGSFCDGYYENMGNLNLVSFVSGIIYLLIGIVAILGARKYIKQQIIAHGLFFGGILLIILAMFYLFIGTALYSLWSILFPLLILLILIYFAIKKEKVVKKNKKK